MESSSTQRDSLLADLRESGAAQRRRLSEIRAREHVGAAGWAQNATLESIIRLGREGLTATKALREVVTLTTEQLRALPLVAIGEHSTEHLSALQDVVARGNEQIVAAHALDQLIFEALDEVSVTPLDEMSVNRLKNIRERVQAQAGALSVLTEAAQAQADTLEQVAELEKVSADHQQRVNDLRQFSAGETVDALGEAGETIVKQIADLDDAASKQLGALRNIGEALVTHVPETAATPQAQADTLDELAQAAQARADELRDSAE